MTQSFPILLLLCIVAVLLYLFAQAHFCIAGFDSYFVIGFLVIALSWAVAFYLLRDASPTARLSGMGATTLITLLLWILFMLTDKFHFLCW